MGSLQMSKQESALANVFSPISEHEPVYTRQGTTTSSTFSNLVSFSHTTASNNTQYTSTASSGYRNATTSSSQNRSSLLGSPPNEYDELVVRQARRSKSGSGWSSKSSSGGHLTVTPAIDDVASPITSPNVVEEVIANLERMSSFDRGQSTKITPSKRTPSRGYLSRDEDSQIGKVMHALAFGTLHEVPGEGEGEGEKEGDGGKKVEGERKRGTYEEELEGEDQKSRIGKFMQALTLGTLHEVPGEGEEEGEKKIEDDREGKREDYEEEEMEQEREKRYLVRAGSKSKMEQVLQALAGAKRVEVEEVHPSLAEGEEMKEREREYCRKGEREDRGKEEELAEEKEKKYLVRAGSKGKMELIMQALAKRSVVEEEEKMGIEEGKEMEREYRKGEEEGERGGKGKEDREEEEEKRYPRELRQQQHSHNSIARPTFASEFPRASEN